MDKSSLKWNSPCGVLRHKPYVIQINFGAKFAMMVNKIDRPNTTPTVRGICTFAVYFSVFRPFCRFTLVYEGHFVLCYKEKIEPLDRAMANFKRS